MENATKNPANLKPDQVTAHVTFYYIKFFWGGGGVFKEHYFQAVVLYSQSSCYNVGYYARQNSTLPFEQQLRYSNSAHFLPMLSVGEVVQQITSKNFRDGD